MTYLSDLPAGFAFDPVQHIYRVDGVRWPSVTEILTDLNLGADYSRVDPAVLASAATRGRMIHRAVALHLEDDLDFDSVDDSIVRHVETAIEVMRAARVVPWQVEQPVLSRSHRYAGTLDIVGLVYDRPGLIDVKSGETKIAARQTAGYMTAWRESLLQKYHPQELDKDVLTADRWCLDLRGSGKLTPLTEQSDFHVFNAAACVWHAQRAHN